MTQVLDAIRSRRTHKIYAGGAISRETLTSLLEAATWAPNHRYTEPWRFYVIHGTDKLSAMNEHVQRALDAAVKNADGVGIRKFRAKKAKMATRLESTAAVVVVTWSRSAENLVLDREDYAATACAIQNLLLAAHDCGYASLWSSGKMLMGQSMRTFYGIDLSNDEESIAGVIFLGTPVSKLEGRRKKAVDSVTHWV